MKYCKHSIIALSSHPLMMCIIFIFILLNVITYTNAFMQTNDYHYQILLSTNLFGYNLVPAFLLFSGFGMVRYNSYLRVRLQPTHEILTNFVWTLICAAIFALLPVIIYCLFELRSERISNIFPVASSAFAQLTMELYIIGIILILLTYFGLPWGFTITPMIALCGIATWMFSGIAPWLIYIMFYYIQPLHMHESLFLDRTLPFLGALTILIMLNHALYVKHDYLGV